MATELKVERFPVVPEAARPRQIIFDALSEEECSMLRERGYDPILLRILPRTTPEEDRKWLGLLIRGVEEGTVSLGDSREKALVADLKIKRLIDYKSPPKDLVGEVPTQTLEDSFDWEESRHTIDNTTAPAPEAIREFLRLVEQSEQKGKPHVVYGKDQDPGRGRRK